MKKKVKLNTINMTLESRKVYDNFERLKTGENPTYKLTDKKFSAEACDHIKEFEYLFNNDNPLIEDDGEKVNVYVSGVYVGYMKKGDAETYRNLAANNRIDHYDVEAEGGNYKMLLEWDGNDGKTHYNVVDSRRSYKAKVSLFVYPDGYEPPNPIEEKKKKRSTLIKIVGFIIACCLLGILFGDRENTEQPAEKVIEKNDSADTPEPTKEP